MGLVPATATIPSGVSITLMLLLLLLALLMLLLLLLLLLPLLFPAAFLDPKFAPRTTSEDDRASGGFSNSSSSRPRRYSDAADGWPRPSSSGALPATLPVASESTRL